MKGVKIPIAMREILALAIVVALCLEVAALPLPEGAFHRIGAGFPVSAAAAGESIYVVTSIALEHWDLASGELLGEVPLPWTPEIVSFPSGADLVALVREGKLSVLGLPEGAEILSVEKERGITALSFSSDLLAVGYEGGLVEVLHGESGEVLIAKSPFDGDVTVLSFSHKGEFLAVAGKGDQDLYLLRVDSGDIVAKFPWNRWGIVSVAFSPDGRLIAIGANDSVIRVWDLGERRLLVNLTSPVGPPRILTFAERDLLAVGTFGTVARWSVPDWSPGAPIDLGIDTSRPALSGKTLVSYPKRGPVVVVDFASGEILGRLGEGRYLGRITATEFSPDGDLLALGTDAGTIHLFDPSWKEAFLAEGPAGAVDSLSFSPDGGRYLIAASGGRVWIWEVGEGEAKLLRQFLAHTKPISEIDFSPEGDRFLTASWDETVRVWDLEGKLLLSLWKAARVEALQPLIRDATFAAAFSPRGDLIASGHEDKTVRLWELQGKRLHILKKHWGVVWCVAFSPDGKILASGGEGGMVVLWDVKRKRTLRVLRDDGVPVYSLAFSADGKLLFVGDAEGTLEVYSVEKGARVTELRGHLGPIYGIAVHPEGDLLVTASADGTALVWDVGELLR